MRELDFSAGLSCLSTSLVGEIPEGNRNKCVVFGMQKFLLMALMLLNLSSAAQVSRGGNTAVEKEIAAYLQAARDSSRSNLPFTIQVSQKAIELARSHRLEEVEQKCFLTLVEVYEQYDRYDFMVRNYDRAINLGLPNTDQIRYQKLPFLEKISDTDKAIKDAKSIMELARSQGNEDEESNALIVLGNIYGKIGQPERSLAYLEQAENLVDKDDLQKQAYVQGYMGDKYNQMNQNVKAEGYYRNSIEIGSQIEDSSLLESNFNRLNDIYQQQSRNSDIIALNNSIANRPSKNSKKGRGEDEIEENPDLPTLPSNEGLWSPMTKKRANLNLAQAHLENRTPEMAIDILEDLDQELAEQDLKESSELHKLLSQAYDQSGRFQQALVEYKTYVALQDSLLKQKDLKIAETLKKNEELQELENQVLFLELEKELDANTIALNESDMRLQRTISWGVLGFALVSIVFLVVVVRKNRAKTKANDLLELKSLRTRMNPHFIFNSLNSVNHFIAQNDEKSANQYLSRFSKLMRDVLESSEADFIPLDKEIELLDVYLKLEHQRFEDKFDYQLEIGPGVRDLECMIPPMLVQPFIENAIWHGLRYIDYPGILAVRFLQQGEALLIEVEDNGIGRKASQALKTRNQSKNQSTGIRNSRSRVEVVNKVYGESIGIDILDKTSPKSGTLVKITLQNKHGN